MTRVPTGYRLFLDVRDEMGRDALHVALETDKKQAVEWDKASGKLYPVSQDSWRSSGADTAMETGATKDDLDSIVAEIEAIDPLAFEPGMRLEGRSYPLLVKDTEPPTQAAPAQAKNKGGRPTKWDWLSATAFAAWYIGENDYPPQQSQLVAKIASWFEGEGHGGPNQRDLERWVSSLYQTRERHRPKRGPGKT